jgi:DNA-binding response OmpR family regulator
LPIDSICDEASSCIAPPHWHVSNDRQAILIVDDDLGTRETVNWMFSREGFHVSTARCGAEGLTLAGSQAFDLLLIDLQLPDMLGTEFARSLPTPVAPFVIISAYLTIETTVEAMKLGAANVIEKPMTIDGLRAAVFSLIGNAAGGPAPETSRRPVFAPHDESLISPEMKPRSAAERWAVYVAKACQSEEDLTTVGGWAAYVGVSASSLSESCHLVGVLPRDARNLARLLRALLQAAAHDCEPEALLLVSDRRTLKMLIERAGLHIGAKAGSLSVSAFLDAQQFVSADNLGLRALRKLLDANSEPRN